jgi:hypothetical protein
MECLFNKELSLTFLWVKDRKILPLRPYITQENKDIGLCYRTYISCRAGSRSLKETLKSFARMFIPTSDASYLLSLHLYQRWKPFLSQSCRTQLRLLTNHLRILRLTSLEPLHNSMKLISRKLLLTNRRTSKLCSLVFACSIP